MKQTLDLPLSWPCSVSIVTSIAAMVTHIVICIKAGTWGLLIAGAILPFIGVVHGVGRWIGAW